MELLSNENKVSSDSDMYSDDWKQFAGHVDNFLTVQHERFIALGLIWDEWGNSLQALYEDKDIARNPNPYAKVVRGMASFWLRPVIR